MQARRQSLVQRTNRSFAAMLAWGVITAVVSLVAVNSLVGNLRAEARQAARESALLSFLEPVLNEAEGAGHDLATSGSESLQYFEDVQAELRDALATGAEVFEGAREQRAVAELRAAIGVMYEPLYVVAANPALGPDVSSVGADVGALQDHLGIEGEQVRNAVFALDDIARENAGAEIEAGERAQRQLTIALAVLFGLSLATTVYFARRVRQDVVVPVRSLGDSARRFAGGDLQHRSDIEHPEEFAVLAAGFNAMAAVLDATHQDLTHQVRHDALTGVANRRSFVEQLDRAVAADDESIGVVFIDLDDFKEVNDAFGHLAGDHVLQQVALRIGECVRQSDVVARFGGDEFAVLLAPPANPTVAASVADRILERLGAPVDIWGASVTVGASVGVALREVTGAGADDLLEQADRAMYRAKRSGKNRYEVFAEV